MVPAAVQAQKKPAYTAKDLAGIKVFHSADSFKEGESVVLTMKDARILDEHGACRVPREPACARCGPTAAHRGPVFGSSDTSQALQ